MTLTDSELILYKTHFELLDRLYSQYLKYDNQIKNHISWNELDDEDLHKLLELSGPSSTRFKIVREIQKLEDVGNHIYLIS